MKPNVLTVDVEDWYHDAEGLAGQVLSSPVGRVSENLRQLLDLLEEAGARATFFVLGEVAELEPGLVRNALARGHEIASHGFHHRPVRSVLRREFRADVERSRMLLEDVTGEPVTGFRAPYFSIKAGVRWPLEIVRDAGFIYDSSILPIDRLPGFELVSPRVPYVVEPIGLWEIPVAVPRFLFWHLPLFGGAALRLLPSTFVQRELVRFRRSHGPAVLHVHPWEIDPEGPESVSVPRVIRVFKKIGRQHVVGRIRELASTYGFTSIREAFPEVFTGKRMPSI